MMDQLIERFPAQLREGIEIARAVDFKLPDREFRNIVLCGMGGSAIGGAYTREWVRDDCSIPFLINRRYDLPASVDEYSLLIGSSYSGNTEETRIAVQNAAENGAFIVAVTGGGQLADWCKEHNFPTVIIPGDWPSPRACLGYSFTAQLGVLLHLELIDGAYLKSVSAAAEMLENEMDVIRGRAEQLAHLIREKTPVIYATDVMEPVAVRFRQQLNENSKMLAWHHIIPEMNHNELVGWRDQRNDLATIFMRTKSDHPRNAVRTEISKEIIGSYAGSIMEIKARGDDPIQQALYLTHLVDWVSWFLAEQRGVDAIEVRVIDYLKNELKKADNDAT